MRGLLLGATLLAAGCGGGGQTVDGAVVDFAVDSAVADMAAFTGDLRTLPDLTKPPPTGADYAGCKQPFADLTSNDPATITFGFINGKNEYVPSCATVTIGHQVIWMGDQTTLVDNPLVMASTNLSLVTPTQTAPDAATVTFNKPGYYGYYSKSNGSDDGTGMAGLIQVVQ